MSERPFDFILLAPVYGVDALVGRVEHVIVDPVRGKTTHLVVREQQQPHTLRLVPEKYIATAGPEGVTLSLPKKNVAELREYIQTEYYSPDYFLALAKKEHCKLPLAPSGWSVEHPATPEGAIALVGHEPVMATDGKIGQVDGVLADAHTGRISHLVLRQGHLWGAREVEIPAALVTGYEAGQVLLGVDKATVGALPAFHVV